MEIIREKNKVAQNEKRKNLCGFSYYSKNMANFEACLLWQTSYFWIVSGRCSAAPLNLSQNCIFSVFENTVILQLCIHLLKTLFFLWFWGSSIFGINFWGLVLGFSTFTNRVTSVGNSVIGYFWLLSSGLKKEEIVG